MNPAGGGGPHQPRFLSRAESRQHQDGVADAVLPDRNALVRTGDAKPVRAGLLQCLGHFGSAMAVAVAFDDGENFARRFAFFLRRVFLPPLSLPHFSPPPHATFPPSPRSPFFSAS